MNETELMRTEIARVMSRAHPPVVMNIQDVAALFGYSEGHIKNELQNRPDFPPKLSRFKSPHWARDAVLQWAGVK